MTKDNTIKAGELRVGHRIKTGQRFVERVTAVGPKGPYGKTTASVIVRTSYRDKTGAGALSLDRHSRITVTRDRIHGEQFPWVEPKPYAKPVRPYGTPGFRPQVRMGKEIVWEGCVTDSEAHALQVAEANCTV